ncbi:MAG: YraN family protein [Planctomycetaceae bacterium]|nr:YraN family protein [Planctomycetaceae bacterium]
MAGNVSTSPAYCLYGVGHGLHVVHNPVVPWNPIIFFRRRGPLTTAESGVAAQRFAERALKRQGYRTIARNLADGGGELDLVMRHKGFDGMVVIEVRSYSANTNLRQEEVLPPSKQEQVVSAARRLLPRLAKKSSKDRHQGIRFDAVLVKLDATSGRPVSMEHFENAFTSTRRDWF